MNLERLAKDLAPDGAKEVVRGGFRRFGTLTAQRRPLPDYLIIGAKRGGTTSLWKNLRRHPQVLPMFPAAENLKSPHFFDINWSRGESWYRSYFPTSAQRDRRAQQTGEPVVAGDASPYYLYHPRAAERARHVVPHAKIIVALRHPVDRAWSHFNERRKEGTEPLPFEAALDAEPARISAELERMAADPTYYSRSHDFCSYLARGRYLEQLEPWFSAFGEDNVLVVRSESYYEAPTVVLDTIFEFLGIRREPTGLPVEHLNRLASGGMDPELRVRLNDYYRPHVAELEAALGRDFGWDLENVETAGR